MAECAYKTGEFIIGAESFLPISTTQVVDVYRTKIRADIEGIEGDEIARKRVEDYANSIRPKGFLVSSTHYSLGRPEIPSGPCYCSFR